ncbi:MAG: 50S ribosome-binding GTPase, partial [Planctomycetota bacterium]|nr:50S ribosome-binding GTPase [Planctomycetota bacterium]
MKLSLVAIIGGASSGKSTVFNNLLGGQPISQVTIRSHTTRGPILAIHEALRDRAAVWLEHEHALLPTLRARMATPDDPIEGTPDTAVVV